jgi:hypothetical protein
LRSRATCRSSRACFSVLTAISPNDEKTRESSSPRC